MSHCEISAIIRPALRSGPLGGSGGAFVMGWPGAVSRDKGRRQASFLPAVIYLASCHFPCKLLLTLLLGRLLCNLSYKAIISHYLVSVIYSAKCHLHFHCDLLDRLSFTFPVVIYLFIVTYSASFHFACQLSFTLPAVIDPTRNHH